MLTHCKERLLHSWFCRKLSYVRLWNKKWRQFTASNVSKLHSSIGRATPGIAKVMGLESTANIISLFRFFFLLGWSQRRNDGFCGETQSWIYRQLMLYRTIHAIVPPGVVFQVRGEQINRITETKKKKPIWCDVQTVVNKTSLPVFFINKLVVVLN